MPTPSSRLAYDDCFNLYERASDDDEGIRVRCDDYGAARQLQVRLHSARRIDRADNSQSHDEGHPLYGRSVYDAFVVRTGHDNRGWFIEIAKRKDNLEVESLSDGADHDNDD